MKNWCYLWFDCDVVWSYFKVKCKFDCWDEDVLCDYVEYGIELMGCDYECILCFLCEIEYQIYWMLLINMGCKVVGGMVFFVSFVVGICLCEICQVGLGVIWCIVGGRLCWIEGSYFYLMEKLFEMVELICELINEMYVNIGVMWYVVQVRLVGGKFYCFVMDW